jgi:uncharacterized membrane protein
MLLAWTWRRIHGLSPDETKRRATAEDDTRAEAGIILLAASVMSLFGVGLGLIRAAALESPYRALLTILSVLTIVLSWSVVHTVFALRYAHEYYTADGGIVFGEGTDAPDYQDFAYLAFTVGMTFQVSDTQVTSRVIRRTLLRHALLSYLFGTVIVAVTINVVAGLVQN